MPKNKNAPKRDYADLHDHLEELDRRGLLVRVDREINKDTELHPLVRWQFRGGIEEKDRKLSSLPMWWTLKDVSSTFPSRLVC